VSELLEKNLKRGVHCLQHSMPISSPWFVSELPEKNNSNVHGGPCLQYSANLSCLGLCLNYTRKNLKRGGPVVTPIIKSLMKQFTIVRC
jgi:hypothetical protein